MYDEKLLKILQVDTLIQEIENLIPHLNAMPLKYHYLQQITALRKELLQNLLLYYGVRAPNTPFSLDELQQNYSGKNNQPAYIAIDGIVYDVSYEPSWGGGTHFGQVAGTDLSTVFSQCHSQSKANILSQLIPVGILKQ